MLLKIILGILAIHIIIAVWFIYTMVHTAVEVPQEIDIYDL